MYLVIKPKKFYNQKRYMSLRSPTYPT